MQCNICPLVRRVCAIPASGQGSLVSPLLQAPRPQRKCWWRGRSGKQGFRAGGRTLQGSKRKLFLLACRKPRLHVDKGGINNLCVDILYEASWCTESTVFYRWPTSAFLNDGFLQFSSLKQKPPTRGKESFQSLGQRSKITAHILVRDKKDITQNRHRGDLFGSETKVTLQYHPKQGSVVWTGCGAPTETSHW